jgi:NAD+ synthase (glutamine-hydrolysing)
VEIGEDLWATDTVSRSLAAQGATIIVNPSASAESVGVADYRRMLVQSTSARLLCGYVCANAGPEESTQDAVYSQHHLIAENGVMLAENKPFGTCDLLISEIDVQRLADERLRNSLFESKLCGSVAFKQPVRQTKLTRHFDANPFVPDNADMDARAESILQIQAHGLAKRLDLTWSKKAVVGISGGLDSTLALLVMVRAMDLLGRPHSDVLAVTMPCFGTSKRTKNNAITLCNELGVELQEVNIMAAVQQHFKDIGHDPSVLDVTYENSQARERTQVLMDIANQCNGLVVGTGDLSELALGWATYNGDHMSMYGVNGDVPKTLVRVVVRYEAMRSHDALRDVLLDILDTPVSPELLPVDDKGQIAQKTEDLVGPYELHDFFLFHTVRSGFTPSKIFRLAQHVFAGVYSDAVILHWLRTFTRRFFNQQFKRSCIPDGPKVGSVALSPRGDWRMPSDASSKVWLDEIAELEKADHLK